ncbi:MAG TPA: DNA primase [Acidimicrobiales bacterium]|nr:DNA primase [Acidimicrobiales bacterium]
MGIVDDDIVRIREATNLRDVVSQYVQLKRVGRRWVGLCPFHAEKTGSFNVNEENGLFKCFGCGKGGDAITFVREIEHLDFVGAVEWLAGKVGMTVRYTEKREDEGRKQRARLIDAMRRAVDWYHQRLLKDDDAGPARGYLRSRGLSGDIARQYQLGWAPEGWDTLARALRLPDEILVDTGLGFLNRRGGQTDAFRERLLFPIFDTNGDPVAFGGRVLPGGEGPKYKNSSGSAIYDKSKVLYGLNWAKADVVNADEVVVCEGYTDVIGFGAAGVPRAVATCGTALTIDHLRTLRKFARRVVLAFDADAAGQEAAARFYQWERDLDLDVAVAALPSGVDPGDLGQSDPARLTAAVADAMPFLGFRVNRVLDSAGLASPEGRAKAAEAALAVIREHPSELVRDQYVMQVAERCRIEPEQLRARSRSAGAKLVAVDRGAPVASRVWLPETPEVNALLALIHEPDVVDPLLMMDTKLTASMFSDLKNLAAFNALASTASLHEAIEVADVGASELLLQLSVAELDGDAEDAVAGLVREAARRAIRAVATSETPIPLAVHQALNDINEPNTKRAAIDELLTWLGSRSEEDGG